MRRVGYLTKNREHFAWVCTWFFVFYVAVNTSRADDNGVQPNEKWVTVADTIQMTTWADRGYFWGGTPDSPVALFSPDQKQFIVNVRKGNIENNTNEYSLLLFQAKDVFQATKPRVLVNMSSSSNRDAIAHVKWLDNGTIAFLGENPGESPQVYSVDIVTGRRRKLTHHPTPVVAFDVSDGGREIIYEAVPPAMSTLDRPETRRTGVVISTQELADLLVRDCDRDRESNIANRELFLQTVSNPATKIASKDYLTEVLPVSLSPSGRYGLIGVYLRDIPVPWSGYQDKLLRQYITEPRKPGQVSNVIQYMLLDTATSQLSPLIDAPQSWYNLGLAWAQDEQSVVVSGAYLPFEKGDQADLAARKTRTFVVEVMLSNREIRKITDADVRVTKWDHTTGKLVLESGYFWKKLPREVYRKTGSEWKLASTLEEDNSRNVRLDVTLEEDINTPPKIVVSESKTHRNAVLFDLNPQLTKKSLGRVEAVAWQGKDGREVEGGLYLPPDYSPGRRYPLLIQTHGFRKDRFWINGPWNSGFAAQPLAALGIVVLQVGYAPGGEDMKYTNTPDEAPRQMAGYEGAVDYLDSRGLIDRNRVGLLGFSRTGFYVAFTLTHSKYHFAAATLADGFEAGYMNYLLWPNTDYIGVNGGTPLAANLESWTRNSPGFNLDKVKVPVRLEDYGPLGVLAGWQWFSGLSLLDKPVDFVWLPYASHLLVKPWERLTSQQSNVDWFAFWLKGAVDPDPAKREEYARWRAWKN
jgi:dipeptidyl aminopeptidase/acylaminoacyl peptidase